MTQRALCALSLVAAALLGTMATAKKAPPRANVEKVEVRHPASGYQFLVTLLSADVGCEQYADWWEVITPEGKLIYRRILAHSHADEQPFTRRGGPVNISNDTEVIIRGHMNNYGYGGRVMRGTIKKGFKPTFLSRDFHAELAKEPPLPDGCAF